MPYWWVALLVLVLGLAVTLEPVRFALVGVVGAIFANSTGAGGGVVFIPLFSQIGFTEAQAVSTSFGIQCFGMTAGAITWSVFYHRLAPSAQVEWRSFGRIVLICSLASIAGIWTNYAFDLQPLASLHAVFRVFSAILGLCILATMILRNNEVDHPSLTAVDAFVLLVLAYAGGILTGWLSVAVGEIVAFYLIFRRYNVMLSIASAVVITAITVWSVAPVHLAADSAVVWEVLRYAGPGAVVGGIVARFLVTFLPGQKIKLLFACWLLLISVVG